MHVASIHVSRENISNCTLLDGCTYVSGAGRGIGPFLDCIQLSPPAREGLGYEWRKDIGVAQDGTVVKSVCCGSSLAGMGPCPTIH